MTPPLNLSNARNPNENLDNNQNTVGKVSDHDQFECPNTNRYHGHTGRVSAANGDNRRQEHLLIPNLDHLTRAFASLTNQPLPTPQTHNLSIMDMYGLVPKYDGKTSPENCIDYGDFVYQALGLTQVPIFFNLIKVRLSGRVHNACLRENFASWKACKRVLRPTCQTKCSSAKLKAKLQAMV